MADEAAPSPVAKTEVWTLGLLGVDVVNGPLHLVDGDLLQAQNAEPFTEEGEGGIRKRLGIALFTPGTLPAGVFAITSIPLPDPFRPINVEGTHLWANTSTDGTGVRVTSTNGTTWTDANAPRRSTIGSGSPDFSYQRGGHISRAGTMFFYSGELYSFNGAETVESSNTIAAVTAGTPMNLFEHDDDIYAIVDNGVNQVLVKFNGSAWELVATNAGFNGFVAASAFGRIYVPSDTQRMAYWTADGGFVNEGIFTGNVGGTMPPSDIAVGGMALYVTLDRNGQDPELVWKKTGADDAWVDITPAGNATGVYGPMAYLNDVLYVGRHSSAAAPAFTGAEVWKYDGTTFTLDKDLTTLLAGANRISSIIAFNDELYLTVRRSIDPSHNIVRRDSNGTYSTVVSENGVAQRAPNGPIGFY